jgi:16S rRNA (adenine(1408)-N(1))-methyltransferase
VTIDLGTGDVLSVYKRAQENPERFFIGIDPNRRPLEKISEKIYRRPAKGGLTNVLYVQAAAEALPAELDGVASKVQIEFPWGSLLRGVAGGDKVILSNLRRLCLPNALLEVTIAIDPDRDRSEWARLELATFTIDHVLSVLVPKYCEAGFKIVRAQQIGSDELAQRHSSWARRLHRSPTREFFKIDAVVDGQGSRCTSGLTP